MVLQANGYCSSMSPIVYKISFNALYEVSKRKRESKRDNKPVQYWTEVISAPKACFRTAKVLHISNYLIPNRIRNESHCLGFLRADEMTL